MALIFIWFALPQDDPEDPTYVIRVKTKHGNARAYASFVFPAYNRANADLVWIALLLQACRPRSERGLC